ncbi:MAG: hypothetical protein K6F08_02970 [bacterium]|nr:hypothetical protein [bacterium]
MGKTLQAKASGQWLRDLPTGAVRGSITDRNGVVLASDEVCYDVYVRPNDILSAESVALVLSSNIEISYSEALEKATKKGIGEIKVASLVSREVMQNILKDYQNGIFFSPTSKRNYTYDNLLCNVLGFVSSDRIGQTGLEAYYDKFLSGVNGESLVEADIKGKTLEDSSTYYIEAINGLNLSLTIDFRIQKAVEEILQEMQYNTNSKSVSAIVLNTKTSEILALATLPNFDLNNVPRDDVNALMNLSRCTPLTDAYEPGSTFKVVTCAIAMELGLTGEHDYFYCSGYRIVNGVKINCHRHSGHGSQSLAQGLSNSCNCVFMELANRIGLENFYKYLDLFGLTSGYGIDFYGEGKAVTMPKNLVTAADLVRMGFGQSVAITPMGLINAVSAIANGGNLMQPYFVKSIDNGVSVLYEKRPTKIRQVISNAVSESMNRMLEKVVDGGGGKRAMVAGYRIAGKTGTAQKYENNAIADGKYVASFIGYAPADNPEFTVLVIADEPQGAYYGGVVSAPVAGQIFEKIFEIENLEPGQSYASDLLSLEKTITLPNLVGKTKTEAVTELILLGLQYLISGDGNIVLGQLDEPGTLVYQNDIILLMM